MVYKGESAQWFTRVSLPSGLQWLVCPVVYKGESSQWFTKISLPSGLQGLVCAEVYKGESANCILRSISAFSDLALRSLI